MRIAILLGAIISTLGIAFEAELVIDTGGLIGYCGEAVQSDFDRDHVPTYVAGAAGELVLTVTYAKTKPETVNMDRANNRWPDGLEIEVGRWDSVTETCHVDRSLQDQLDLHLWRASGWAADDDRNPTLYFRFSLPETLAGQRLCFGAKWTNSPWGELESRPNMFGYNYKFSREMRKADHSIPPPIMVISVIAPCSDGDRQRARESHVFEAWIAGDSPQTLELADSLLAHNWASFSVLMYAEGAAKELGQFDRAMQYLDACYQRYGRVGAPADSASEIREYQRMRTDLIEQQQHQR